MLTLPHEGLVHGNTCRFSYHHALLGSQWSNLLPLSSLLFHGRRGAARQRRGMLHAKGTR